MFCAIHLSVICWSLTSSNCLNAICAHFFLLIVVKTVCHHIIGSSEWNWFMPLFHPLWYCLSTTLPAYLIPKCFSPKSRRGQWLWLSSVPLSHKQVPLNLWVSMNGILPKNSCRNIHNFTLSHQAFLMYLFIKEPFVCPGNTAMGTAQEVPYIQIFPWGQELSFSCPVKYIALNLAHCVYLLPSAAKILTDHSQIALAFNTKSHHSLRELPSTNQADVLPQ